LDSALGAGIPAILQPLLDSYGDVLDLARRLTDRAAAGGHIEPVDLLVYRRIFETAESQLASMRVLLELAQRGGNSRLEPHPATSPVRP